MKKRTIIDIFLIFILLIFLIFLGTRDYQNNKKEDSKRFDEEYSMVSNNNIFKYADEEEINTIIKSGEGIIFMAFNENEWANYYAKILNDSAKNNNIKEIYYYDFLLDRQKDSITYRKIIDFLKEHLKQNDLGKIDISSPSLVVLKNGNVFAFDDETSIMNGNVKPEEYWTEENINKKMQQFDNIFTLYLGGTINGGEE